MRPEEKSIVVDYVFETESNTAVALKLLGVEREIRARVIEHALAEGGFRW